MKTLEPETSLPRKLTISRKTWGRGDNDAGLLNGDTGKMCCLGFAGKQLCNAKDDDLRWNHSPIDIEKVFRKELPWLFGEGDKNYSSVDSVYLMAINDDRDMNESEREEQIAAIFKKHEIEVIFED